jgi:hypothetical protein
MEVNSWDGLGRSLEEAKKFFQKKIISVVVFTDDEFQACDNSIAARGVGIFGASKNSLPDRDESARPRRGDRERGLSDSKKKKFPLRSEPTQQFASMTLVHLWGRPKKIGRPQDPQNF